MVQMKTGSAVSFEGVHSSWVSIKITAICKKKKRQFLKKDWCFFLFCYLLSFRYSLFLKLLFPVIGYKKEDKRRDGFACSKQGFLNIVKAVYFYQTFPAVRLVTKFQAVHTQIKIYKKFLNQCAKFYVCE